MTAESPTKPTSASPNYRLKTLIKKAKEQLNPFNQARPRTTMASRVPMYASTSRALEELESKIIREQFKVIETQSECIERQEVKIEAQKVVIEDLRKRIRNYD